MAQEKRVDKMFWIDMEMTGLDEKKEVILEIAAVVTDLDQNPLDEYHALIHQPPEVLAKMDDWCTKTHGKSGLTEAVATGIPLAEAEDALVNFARKHFQNERVVLCGNSVGQDRRFIDAYMPKFAGRLHYRLVDISSFKEVFRNKYGIYFPKKESHRARDDIFESIAELKAYLKLVQPPAA